MQHSEDVPETKESREGKETKNLQRICGASKKLIYVHKPTERTKSDDSRS